MENAQKRDHCPRCQSPQARCLCDFTPKNLTSPLPLIILRHKDEKNHYLNTAKILELSLTNAKIFDGEIFSTDIFNDYPTIKNWVLIFPTEDSHSSTELKEKNPPSKIEGIIMIDGTWKKAKKIFYLNSFLQNLPKAKLAQSYPSQYELRKCGKENFLSTLEAYVYFFKEWNSEKENNENEGELLTRLKKMIQKQKGLYSLKE